MTARLQRDPHLVAALWLIVAGALLVALTLTCAALVEMNRTYPPVVHVPERSYFTFEPVR